jgi:hypothetical protein
MPSARETAQRRNGGVRASVGISWPQERWVGALIVVALALLILIRVGFRGIGVTGSVSGAGRIGL